VAEDARSGEGSKVRAELVSALEQPGASGSEGAQSAGAAAFLVRVAGRLRNPNVLHGPAGVQAAKATRRVTARFGFDHDVAEVFVALAGAIADEAAETYGDELSGAKAGDDASRLAKLRSVPDQARARKRVSDEFVAEMVPSASRALAGIVPAMALQRPLAHPSLAVGAAVAGGLAETALIGTSAIPAALALSVVTEAAETYAQSSVLVRKFRDAGIEPEVGDVLAELAQLAPGTVLGRSRHQASATLRAAALPKVAATLERRVGLRVASLATLLGPALIEGGMATWGVVKASRHRLHRADELPAEADTTAEAEHNGEGGGR
jgi:hypothetical protein